MLCSVCLELDGYTNSRHDICTHHYVQQGKKKNLFIPYVFFIANDLKAPNRFALNLNCVTYPFFTNRERKAVICLTQSHEDLPSAEIRGGILLEDRDTQQEL